ncbi:MAG TPA: hypothetical protein VMS17_26080 [Gemmataceae bacterium]|nr:hypothetical protein [Gemmataceae bacterium]
MFSNNHRRPVGRHMGTAQPVRPRIRPMLEALELRIVPATVTSLADSGPGSLRDLVETAPAGDVIDFSTNLGDMPTITLTTGPILLPNSLTIDGGNNIRISAGNDSRIFYDPNNTDKLIIQNLTMEDGSAQTKAAQDGGVKADQGQGGAVYDLGNLILINDNFSSNSAATDGGAVYASGAVTVTNCSFMSNRAISGSGGALYSFGALSVTGGSFVVNHASGNGGAIEYAHQMTGPKDTATAALANVSFSGNTAGNAGGAVSTVCAFMYLDPDSLTLVDEGGTAGFRITGCLFSGNGAKYGGGWYASIGNLAKGASSVTAMNDTFFRQLGRSRRRRNLLFARLRQPPPVHVLAVVSYDHREYVGPTRRRCG